MNIEALFYGVLSGDPEADKELEKLRKALVVLDTQPCGHVGLPSMYLTPDGKGQCTECANKMRGK